MLKSVFNLLLGPLLDRTLGPITDLFKQHMQGRITEAELKARVEETLINNLAAVEKTHAESLTSTYSTFISAATGDQTIKAIWAAVTVSQLAVLVWHQFGIPLLCFLLDNKSCWPSSGTTVDWAYALVALCIGGGAVIFRVAPSKTDWRDLLK